MKISKKLILDFYKVDSRVVYGIIYSTISTPVYPGFFFSPEVSYKNSLYNEPLV